MAKITSETGINAEIVPAKYKMVGRGRGMRSILDQQAITAPLNACFLKVGDLTNGKDSENSFIEYPVVALNKFATDYSYSAHQGRQLFSQIAKGIRKYYRNR